MWTKQVSTTSNASPKTIWQIYTDIPNWTAWHDEILDCHIDGAFEPGSKGAMKVIGNPRPLRFVLLEVEPEISFTDLTEIPGANIVFAHLLKQKGDGGTQITHTVTISGLAWEQIAATIGKQLEHGLPQTIELLARLAEKHEHANNAYDTSHEARPIPV
jgi:uncharacterized protein YndB with AHSA1/START domain